MTQWQDEVLAALPSTPAGPTSSRADCQTSMTVPVIEPSSAGGISSTNGPTVFVLMKGMK
jgi:hypothetical protein